MWSVSSVHRLPTQKSAEAWELYRETLSDAPIRMVECYESGDRLLKMGACLTRAEGDDGAEWLHCVPVRVENETLLTLDNGPMTIAERLALPQGKETFGKKLAAAGFFPTQLVEVQALELDWQLDFAWFRKFETLQNAHVRTRLERVCMDDLPTTDYGVMEVAFEEAPSVLAVQEAAEFLETAAQSLKFGPALPVVPYNYPELKQFQMMVAEGLR